MKLYGSGRAALVNDSATAERLEWPARRRSAPEPDILLSAAAGDPTREPWIASGPRRSGAGPEALWRRTPKGAPWTYLKGTPGLDPCLKALAAPLRRKGFTVGISGLGRVGGLAASALAALDKRATGIDTLLLHDTDAANLERMRLELASVARWHRLDGLPRVEVSDLPGMMRRCDAFLFAAAADVPPLGTTGDVRLPQFHANRAILAPALAAAASEGYAGLFLMISDPVEVLAQAAFHDSNAGADGRFQGGGLAPERVAGLALGVMWGRALACAQDLGLGEAFLAKGALYGPHSTEVLVFDDPRNPDPALCALLSEAARKGNFKVRDTGHLPYIGPALSSIVLTLPSLLMGREVLASPFVDGLYFGSPCRLGWGMTPVPGPMAPAVRSQVQELFQLLQARMDHYGVSFAPAPPTSTNPTLS